MKLTDKRFWISDGCYIIHSHTKHIDNPGRNVNAVKITGSDPRERGRVKIVHQQSSGGAI